MSYRMDAIRQSAYGPHKILIKNFQVKPLPYLRYQVDHQKMAVMVERMQHGTLSYQQFIDEDSSKHYMLMKNPVYWEYTIAMASKTWPFMEQLNRIIFMQQESGIRYYWEYLVVKKKSSNV